MLQLSVIFENNQSHNKTHYIILRTRSLRLHNTNLTLQ